MTKPVSKSPWSDTNKKSWPKKALMALAMSLECLFAAVALSCCCSQSLRSGTSCMAAAGVNYHMVREARIVTWDTRLGLQFSSVDRTRALALLLRRELTADNRWTPKINGTTVCKRAYCEFHAISKDMLKRALTMAKKKDLDLTLSSKDAEKFVDKQIADANNSRLHDTITWLKTFAGVRTAGIESAGEGMGEVNVCGVHQQKGRPAEDEYVLPCCSKTVTYFLYAEAVELPYTYSHFCAAWKTHCPNITKGRKKNTFSAVSSRHTRHLRPPPVRATHAGLTPGSHRAPGPAT